MNENSNANAQANAETQSTTLQDNVGNNSNVNYDEIFKKLDSILDKRTEGIAKSALKDNGYEDAEMKDILSQYRASKQAKIQEADNKLSTLETENAQLKETLQTERLNTEAMKQAQSLNIDEKAMEHVMKLAEFKGCIDDKGKVDSAKVKTALEKVLNDVPAFKQVEKAQTGVTVGADTSNESSPSGNLFGFNFTGVRKHE